MFGLRSVIPTLGTSEDIAREAAHTVLNERADLAPAILSLCRSTKDGDAPRGAYAMAHYNRLTWPECRETHALVLRELPRWRRVNEEIGKAAMNMKKGDDPGDPRFRMTQSESRWPGYGMSLLARFPTPASLEELCIQLESGSRQTASDALSVCLTPAFEPRAREALAKAQTRGGNGPNPFQRLVGKLQDPKADLSGLPDQYGMRFITPDPAAAAVDDLPNAPRVLAAAPPRGWSWWWLLLLLLIPAGWVARRRCAGA